MQSVCNRTATIDEMIAALGRSANSPLSWEPVQGDGGSRERVLMWTDVRYALGNDIRLSVME